MGGRENGAGDGAQRAGDRVDVVEFWNFGTSPDIAIIGRHHPIMAASHDWTVVELVNQNRPSQFLRQVAVSSPVSCSTMERPNPPFKNR